MEALGYNLNAVSTKNGSIGVDPSLCNGKLIISEDYNWDEFIVNMMEAPQIRNSISPEFFEHFNWENIAKKAARSIDT